MTPAVKFTWGFRNVLGVPSSGAMSTGSRRARWWDTQGGCFGSGRKRRAEEKSIFPGPGVPGREAEMFLPCGSAPAQTAQVSRWNGQEKGSRSPR